MKTKNHYEVTIPHVMLSRLIEYSLCEKSESTLQTLKHTVNELLKCNPKMELYPRTRQLLLEQE